MRLKAFKKIGSIAVNVLLYLFLALCVLSLLFTVIGRKSSDDGAVTVLGRQMRVITSDSMEKCELTDVSEYKIKSIPLRSMVFIETVPKAAGEREGWYRNIKVGDVLTFRYVYTNQITVTHRVTEIAEKTGGGFIITLMGDNKNADTELLTQVIDTSDENSSNYIIGKVTGQSRVLGFIASVLKAPVGIVLTVIVPCAIIMLLEIFKIVGTVGTEKRRRAQEESQRKDDELLALKQRLAELEGERNADLGAESGVSNAENAENT